MRENLMSGIDEGRLDKPMGEACLLLYSTIRIINNENRYP
jgi:hypothetical protein